MKLKVKKANFFNTFAKRETKKMKNKKYKSK